jgi:hypothetical protein
MSTQAAHRESRILTALALAALLLLAQFIAIQHAPLHLFSKLAHGQHEDDCGISQTGKALAAAAAPAPLALPAAPLPDVPVPQPAATALRGISAKPYLSTGPPSVC